MAPPVITHNQLGWAFQTGLVNTIKTPTGFLTSLYFGGRKRSLPTESVELSYKEGDRYMAPFVEVNGEAVMVGGRSVNFANVSTPNIRIKRPMDAYNVFLRRQPGTGIFITGGDVIAQARAAAIAEDAAYMRELIDNRIEHMVATLLTDTTSGSINMTYSVADKASWKISIPRHTDMTVSLAGGAAEWDDNTGSGIEADVHRVKRAFSKHIQRPVKACVMGTTASDLFRGSASIQALLDKKNVSAGTMELINQFQESGAIYLGTVYGVPFWEYSAEYIADDGTTSTPYIPATTAVFLAGGNNEGEIYYGCIPDHGAFNAGAFIGEMFSKSWMEEDPSVYVQLLQSRPLPMIRMPNAHYVLTVT